jgi:hypothetical protein
MMSWRLICPTSRPSRSTGKRRKLECKNFSAVGVDMLDLAAHVLLDLPAPVPVVGGMIDDLQAISLRQHTHQFSFPV